MAVVKAKRPTTKDDKKLFERAGTTEKVKISTP
jgi:hypothetical protein